MRTIDATGGRSRVCRVIYSTFACVLLGLPGLCVAQRASVLQVAEGPVRADDGRFSFSRREAEEAEATSAAAESGNPAKKGSSLDALLGAQHSDDHATGNAIGKQQLFADFESVYMEKSDDTGNFPSAAQRPDKVSDGLAVILPSEYGVSESCIQQRRRDARISGSSQARSIAAVMYDIVDQLAPPRYGKPSGDMVRQRMSYLSQPGMGCPADFPKIRAFLDEFTDFAKAMVDRKKAVVTAKAKQAEREQQLVEARKSEKVQKDAEAEARAAEARRSEKEANDRRRTSLLAGKEKPASFRDHMLMHDYAIGDQYIWSPLVKADNKVYLFGTGSLDRQDGQDLILRSANGYVMVKMGRSTPKYGELQVNRLTVVLGRYIDNTQYTTVMGAIKTAPVIEAIAVAKGPVQ